MVPRTRPVGVERAAEQPRPPVRFNPFSAEFQRDPYPVYRELREIRPVHRTLGMWVLTRHADVRGVLRDRTFSAGLIPRLVSQQADRFAHVDADRIVRLGNKSLVFTDNPDHARLRGLVNRVFTAPAAARLRPRVSQIAERLVQRALDDGGMDAMADFAAVLPLTVMCDWMDLPGSLRAQVGPWTHDIRFLLEPGLMRADDFVRVAQVVDLFAHALDEVVAHRRSAPGDDLISHLLAARTGGGGDRLSDEELVFVCIMCFVAGNETTKSLIGNGLLALLRHPDQGDLLRDRPALGKSAVTEALRYDSPLQLTKRVATRDVEIGEERVRTGDQVLLCLGAANRDPAVFGEPDDFDIGRDARGHLAFGHGMHGCLGGVLAELQAEIAFDHLFRRVGRLELLGGQLQWQDHSFIVRGLKNLPVTVRGRG
ncbi:MULTISPECIES: cytochrome P450 [unclassified Pseudofrankia]|uniref:cytochrome P450 n=1 Tax=unclassified Pseudofrankia TaxID=2994372 RepID=UPI0008D91F44|nr:MULTISPECIES: cytochrome P450 [unclassified Pseudofrankia]MDT3439531.1 cytochrome P450 [Pseudofrankia sp. BMG5.37]OHV48715.1 cytochrome [Pseudofrankia sp. BMG5.36]